MPIVAKVSEVFLELHVFLLNDFRRNSIYFLKLQNIIRLSSSYYIDFNNVSYIAKLLFAEEPAVSLKISDESQSVVRGNTITLHAEIRSYPAPSCIQWIRTIIGNQEEIIEEKGRFSIDVSDSICPKLTIEDLEFSDNGCYIITVTNDFGSVSAKIDIKTEGKYDW